MTTITLTQHKEFDLETQLQLDRMWDTWSRCDKNCAAVDYENERYNVESDRLWAEYNAALDAAYRQKASDEADEFIKRHKSALVAVVSRWGYWQLSRRLTAAQAVQ